MGSGCHPGGGSQPAGGVGQLGGALNRNATAHLQLDAEAVTVAKDRKLAYRAPGRQFRTSGRPIYPSNSYPKLNPSLATLATSTIESSA
jgi:hypothetical protein